MKKIERDTEKLSCWSVFRSLINKRVYSSADWRDKIHTKLSSYRVSKACNYDVSSIMPKTLEFSKNTAV